MARLRDSGQPSHGEVAALALLRIVGAVAAEVATSCSKTVFDVATTTYARVVHRLFTDITCSIVHRGCTYVCKGPCALVYG